MKSKETRYSEENVRKLHIAGACDMLTDLDREGEDNNNGGGVDPRNNSCLSALCERLENRINKEEYNHADQTDDNKMELFVGEGKLVIIIKLHYAVMKKGYIFNNFIENLF